MAKTPSEEEVHWGGKTESGDAKKEMGRLFLEKAQGETEDPVEEGA